MVMKKKANTRLPMKKGKPAKMVYNRNIKKGDMPAARNAAWQKRVKAKRK